MGLTKHHKGGASKESEETAKAQARREPGCRVRAGVGGSEGSRRMLSFSVCQPPVVAMWVDVFFLFLSPSDNCYFASSFSKPEPLTTAIGNPLRLH